MNTQEKAKKAFCEGCNCCQAVLAAFQNEMGMDPDALMRLSSSFGAGIGGLMEICGAVSGMCMVLGKETGYGQNPTPAEKSLHYARIREAAAQFTEKHGSLLCRDLKKGDARTPCAELVGTAAAITEAFLKTKA